MPHKLFVFTRMSNLLLNLAIIEVKNIPNHLLICLIYNARWTRPPQTPLRMQFLHVQLFCWFWRFLTVFSCFWKFLTVFICFWIFLTIFHCFWIFFTVFSYFWSFFTVFSCFWVLYSFWWFCRFSVFDGFITVFGSFWWFLWFLADFGGFGEFKIQWGHRPRVHTSMLNCG